MIASPIYGLYTPNSSKIRNMRSYTHVFETFTHVYGYLEGLCGDKVESSHSSTITEFVKKQPVHRAFVVVCISFFLLFGSVNPTDLKKIVCLESATSRECLCHQP